MKNTEIDTPRSLQETSPKNNRILPETRWTAILVIPFLLTAWGILYLFPTQTEALFAWPINPEMSARLMGAGYLAGAYFFVRAATSNQWHTVQRGFLPVSFFAAWMAVTTLLHWDRFSHGHVSFITWVTIYAITPILILVVWVRNRKADPQTFDEMDARVPKWLRRMMGIFGFAMLLVSVIFYIYPDWMIAFWPWTLSPLTARTTLGFFLIPAGTFIALAFEPRWSAHQIVIQGQILGMALILIGTGLSWENFTPITPAAWVFVVSGFFVLLGLFEYYRMMEMRVYAGGKDDQIE
jgi:hypothetical protein